jgi:hypothetical protein
MIDNRHALAEPARSVPRCAVSDRSHFGRVARQFPQFSPEQRDGVFERSAHGMAKDRAEFDVSPRRSRDPLPLGDRKDADRLGVVAALVQVDLRDRVEQGAEGFLDAGDRFEMQQLGAACVGRSRRA